MSSPRLLVICHGFPPYHGGAELAAGYLAREAVRDGWAVEVLTSDIGGRLPATEQRDGLVIHRLPAPKKEWTRHAVVELGQFYFAARRHAGEFLHPRPDCVLAHFTFPAGQLARYLGRQYAIPYAVVLHGSDVPGYQPERFGLLYPFLKPFARGVWRDAARVIAVSESLRDLAWRTWPGGRIEVIANGVDIEVFRPVGRRPSRDGRLCVIAVAQLIERKGLRFLLEALSGRENLTICGTGPLEAELRSLAVARKMDGRVDFAGAVAPSVMPQRLQSADVFVLPSLQEGLPLALLEAMAAGLAVVATPVGGLPGVLRHEENALLVPPADVESLRTALDRLRDPSLRARLGAAARQAVTAYDWPTVWRRYRALLDLDGRP